MDNKILFEKFSEDKRIYNLNEGYWKRKLNSRLEAKFSEENILFKNYDGKGTKLYDANPIFTFLDLSKKKAIRIIQDDVKEISKNDLENKHVFLSAWFDTIEIKRNNKFEKINELVIALILTKETVDKTMNLISKWLYRELNEIEIEEIIQK